MSPRRQPRKNRSRRRGRPGNTVNHMDIEMGPPTVYHVLESWVKKGEKGKNE